jgi:hypothetical protein
MPKALLNRKTGKQRPFLKTRLFQDPRKRLQTPRRVVKQRWSFLTAARHGIEGAKPLSKPFYVSLLAGTVEVLRLRRKTFEMKVNWSLL